MLVIVFYAARMQSPLNLAVGMWAVGGCIWAAFIEEDHLRKFPAYVAYTNAVPYRFLPRIV